VTIGSAEKVLKQKGLGFTQGGTENSNVPGSEVIIKNSDPMNHKPGNSKKSRSGLSVNNLEP
jgi:hypothetical protein